MPKIFINYRHNDASESASRLYDTLTERFGSQHIFWDHASIHGGRIFFKDIQNAVNTSTTLLVVIGRDWLNIKGEDKKRRLDDPKDLVRWEISTALQRVHKEEDIDVIPILVEGASFPREEDLPADLKKLVEHDYIEIRPHHWKEDVKPLLQIIEKDFKSTFLYSFFGGSIAGLIAGAIVGLLYYISNRPNVGIVRMFLGALYGLLAGALLSYFINSGMTWRSQLLNKLPYLKITGGVIGGALGGILAGIAGWLLFKLVEGGAVSPIRLALAVASTSIFITIGVLLPELRGGWHRTVLSIIISVCVTLVVAAITVLVLQEQLSDLVEEYLAGNHPFSQGVLILGSTCGVMLGFQVSLALFIYDRLKNMLGNNP